MNIKYSSIKGCEFLIMHPAHYQPDGSCRCDDPDHTLMVKWGYRWTGERWA